MSIHRTNHFTAKPGQGTQLAQQLATIMPKIRASEGCIACLLFQSTENPDHILITENWTSVDAHLAAAKNVDPADFQKVMAFLNGQPEGEYFKLVS